MTFILLTVLAAAQTNADVAALYTRGLEDARAAFAKGGSPESLAPVREAIAALAKLSRERPGPAEIARLTLHAAAAAAQSEREEMTAYLEQATWMERLQFEAGQPGAPVITAHEAAGDLWLQLFGYENAERAYLRAAEYVGMTPRVRDGLARARERINATTPPALHF
jgi:hypothetical protein